MGCLLGSLGPTALITLAFASLLTGCNFLRIPVQPDPFYGAVLSQQPQHPGALFAQGTSMMLNGQYRNALVYLTKYTQAEPDRPQGWLNLGQCQLELHLYQDAEKSFRRAEQLQGGPPAQIGLAFALIYEGKLDEAQDIAQNLSQQQPPMAPVERILGDIAFFRRDYQAAAAHYEKSLSLDPNQGDLKGRLRDLQSFLANR